MVGQPLAVSNRAFAAGNRTERDTNTQQDWVGGVKGTWYKDWDYDVNAQWGQSESKGTVTDGYFSQLGFARAWNTVGNTAGSYVDPWSPGGLQNPTLAEAIKAADYVGPTASAKETLTTVNAHTVGDIYTLPAGPVTMNIGGSYYKGDVQHQRSRNSAIRRHRRSRRRDVQPERRSESLERVRRVRDPGHPVDQPGRIGARRQLQRPRGPADAVTGKISGTWKPADWGIFRGSVGNGFRAPRWAS